MSVEFLFDELLFADGVSTLIVSEMFSTFTLVSLFNFIAVVVNGIGVDLLSAKIYFVLYKFINHIYYKYFY